MTKRGWCPSLYEPMPSGDGLLVRVKPPGCVISADAAMALAEAAERFGNGVISLTNRANLQFRGLSPQTAQPFAEMVRGLGLAASDPAVERRRNVIASSFVPLPVIARSDSDAAIQEQHHATSGLPRSQAAPRNDGKAAITLAHTLADMLADPAFAALPGKFGLVVDTDDTLSAAPGDILLHCEGEHVRISLDGDPRATLCAAHIAGAATKRLILAMLDHGAVRMRDMPASLIFAAARLQADKHRRPAQRPQLVGPIEGGFGIGLAFGQTDADGLRALATWARAQGDGRLHLTPWRTILLRHATKPTRLDHPSLITDPASPLLAIDACPGSPACGQSSVATRIDASLLAQALPNLALHVSGCAKGCAHPSASAITLVGEAGRYNLVRHNKASAQPELRGLTVAEIIDLLRPESPQ